MTFSPNGIIIPSALTPDSRRSLWLPPDVARRQEGFDTCDPEFAKDHKMVAYKAMADDGSGWRGQILHMENKWSLDDKGQDGISTRDQIHLVMTGLRERSDNRFVWQKSDEMQGTIYIEEWSELEHCEARWNAFVRRIPPRRDSEQVLDGA